MQRNAAPGRKFRQIGAAGERNSAQTATLAAVAPSPPARSMAANFLSSLSHQRSLLVSETSSSAAGSPSAFKVGFIGAGGIAVHQMNHLKKLGGAEIACAADVSEKSLAGAKELHNIGSTYAD